MLGELLGEFVPAARVLVLELDPRRPERIGLDRLRHALLEFPCGRLGFRCELLALIGRGTVAATRHHQRARALWIGEAEVERRETAHG